LTENFANGIDLISFSIKSTGSEANDWVVISSTFNISDLVAYKSPSFNPDNLLVDLDEPTYEPLLEGPHLPPLPTTAVSLTSE